MFKRLDAREVTEVGAVLADDFVLQSASDSSGKRGKDGRPRPRNHDLQRFLQKFLQRVDLETGPLKLNVFKRAKLSNSFKWRLLEKGLERELVAEVFFAVDRQ